MQKKIELMWTSKLGITKFDFELFEELISYDRKQRLTILYF